MQTLKLKKGHVREDGMVFWNYGKNYPNGEYWVKKEKFEDLDRKKKESYKKYYPRKKHEYRKRDAVYRARNKEKLEKKHKERYSKNREHFLEYGKTWRKNNWARQCASLAVYRARKRGQTPDLSKAQKQTISVFFEQSIRLSKTLGIPFEVDHIIPISKGGLHHPCNLQVIPRSLNRNKHNTKIFIWAEKKS
jgi:hypothetical protein